MTGYGWERLSGGKGQGIVLPFRVSIKRGWRKTIVVDGVENWEPCSWRNLAQPGETPYQCQKPLGKNIPEEGKVQGALASVGFGVRGIKEDQVVREIGCAREGKVIQPVGEKAKESMEAILESELDEEMELVLESESESDGHHGGGEGKWCPVVRDLGCGGCRFSRRDGGCGGIRLAVAWGGLMWKH